MGQTAMDGLFGSGSISRTATAVALLLVATCLVEVVRRRFFHPMSSAPGPWLNSVTEFPAFFNLVTGNQHTYYRSLHEKYGPVVRVSPNELSFVSLEAREEIYGLRKGGLNMEKSPIFLGAVGAVDGHVGVSLALDKEHARQRRALGYLFTNSALLQHEGILNVHTNKLIAILRDFAARGQVIDCSSWYTYVAFDVMGDLCFAEPFGCLDQKSATEWSTSVINVFIAATWTQGIRRLAGVGTWAEAALTRLFVPARAAEWRGTHLENSRQKTLRRLADEDRDHKDFMYHILRSSKEAGAGAGPGAGPGKKALSSTEVVLNMALFISAGTDTTATALTGWTYFVCTHPRAYARVTREVRDALRAGGDVRWEKVKDLRFLEATLHEALRLFPPSPASQQRVVPRGGATVDGYALPAGCTVAVPPWASNRSRLNFCEPDAFRPERWLGEDERFASDRLGASLPFGTGPRVCIGKNLAYLEMRLLTAHLLWHFDMELAPGEYQAKNSVWGLDGRMRPMKVFHSMTKPELWLKLKEVQR